MSDLNLVTWPEKRHKFKPYRLISIKLVRILRKLLICLSKNSTIRVVSVQLNRQLQKQCKIIRIYFKVLIYVALRLTGIFYYIPHKLSCSSIEYNFGRRRSPNELDDLFKDLTNLLIDTYKTNNETKVILVGHSMGNPILLYWLNNYLTQDMKDKYIRAFVSVAPVFGGAVKTLRLMASGDNIDVVVVKPIRLRPYQRSATSTAWLMPSSEFWSSDEVLVSRPERNYTVNDYLQFFQDLNYEIGIENF